MLITNISLPHPVLGLNDDFVGGKYETEIEIAPTELTMNFTVKHKLENKVIDELVSSNKACFCVEINCQSTFYRNSFISNEPIQHFEISQTLLRGRFSIIFYISAYENIKNYVNDSFNPDYKGRSFEINTGDVIAYGGATSFTAIKDWNALKSLKTYITISGNSDTGYMEVGLSSEKIIINLPKDEYRKYLDVIPYDEVPTIIHGSIVYPALIYALKQIAIDPERQEEKEWFQFLQVRREHDPKLQSFEWQQGDEEISRFAQELIGKPIKRMIEKLHSLKKRDSAEE
ncbi:MAG: hypothetical protein AAB662_04520 [Patescibacteria group bacterium]